MTKWRRGQSGNPKGRPAGSRNKATKLRESLEKSVPKVLAKLEAKALSGDVAAMRLLLERTIPALRPREMPVTVDLTQDTGLAERGSAVLEAAAAGEITPHEASTLMQIIVGQVRVIEAEELAARIARLEEAINGTKGKS